MAISGAAIAGLMAIAPAASAADAVGGVLDQVTKPLGLDGGASAAPAPAGSAPTGTTAAQPRASEATQSQESPVALGQGTVASVDVPGIGSAPTSGDPSGGDTGEELVVGRSTGERDANGDYHGHVTIVSVGPLGLEIGVDTDEGETEVGPLEFLQAGILDGICAASAGSLCAEVVRADSTSTNNSSTNSFAVADATIGGPDGVGAEVAESNGNVNHDANCRYAHGDAVVARAHIGSVEVELFESSADSFSCKNGTSGETSESSGTLPLGDGPLAGVILASSDASTTKYDDDAGPSRSGGGSGENRDDRSDRDDGDDNNAPPRGDGPRGGGPGSGGPGDPAGGASSDPDGDGPVTLAAVPAEVAESDRAGGGGSTGELAMTGSNTIVAVLAGLALLGLGLAMRRRSVAQRGTLSG